MLAPTLTAPQSPAPARPARRGRKSASFHSVHDLGAWMRSQPAVTQVVVIRTSDKDKAGFKVMFKAGIAMLAGDPDMQALAAVGAQIVTDAGARDRERLGAYELRRGSVPGGKGYALLGYVMVIGTTLVVLYLETARCADIPGATKDQTRNAFTEALCILLRHFRPQVCHTPLVSRVFRNMDFAGQLLRCLRDLRIRLVAEGSEIPLGRGDDELMAILRAWFSSKEADGLVSRLGNIEIGLYMEGGWYLGENLLPFTWRAQSRTEVNALTGETVRVIEDKHQLEALAEAKPLLHEFLRRAGQQATTRHQLGMLLGAGGVVSRAPRHAGRNVRLDSRPDTELAANAADTLLQERWLTAWEHGHYRRTIKLKADPRAAMPELADRVIDVDDTLYLEIETLMPSPEGGWQVDGLVADVRTRLLADATRPASAGRKNKTGQQKPLNGLCEYIDPASGLQYALTSLESGETYELRCRPSDEALDEHGIRSSWRKDDQWLCSVSARLLHASVAAAISEAVRDLEEQAAVLVLRPATSAAACPLAAELARVRKEHLDAGARLEGIKQRRQTLEGKQQDGTLDVDEQEALAELPDDEANTRAQRRTAAVRVRELADQLASQPAPEQETEHERRADAEFATIELVAEGLARTGYRAPDALHELLARVLRDFRVQPVSYDTAVTWSATLVVPLVTRGEAEFALRGDSPVPSSKRPPRRGDSTDKAALTPEKLSLLFMRDGLDLAEISTLRGVRGDASPGSALLRQATTMLSDVLGISRGLLCAAVDMPPVLRPGLYSALTAEGLLEDPWQRRMRAVYRGTDVFGPTWCMGHQREARRTIDWLEEHADDPFIGLPAWEVARGVGVRYGLLLELSTSKRARVRAGASYGRGPLLGRDFGPGGQGNLALLACRHRDCTELARSGRPGVLVPIATPETTSTLGRVGEVLLGTACRSCRRLPGLQDEILPEHYFAAWTGGRRLQVTLATGPSWVGTRLAPN